MKKQAIVILADGFEEIEAVAPIDLMRRAGITVTTLGLTALEMRGSHGIAIKADMLFDMFSGQFDAIVLPGGPGHTHLLASQKLLETINAAYSRNILCAAICAAPSVLGKAGILKGKKATCFPGYENQLGGGIFIEQKTVLDGNIITSRGAGTALDFGLAIIVYLAGETVAKNVAKKIIL